MNTHANKQEKIIKMFDEIAPSYDITNRIISFGVDKKWRKNGVKMAFSYLKNQKNLKILDIACGSGDMIGVWIDFLNKKNIKNYSIKGCDASENMLKIAQKKYENIDFFKAYAQKLPYQNAEFDALSIAYGIRNVTNLQKALSEFYKILNDDGILLILEFAKENNGFIGYCRDFYIKKILPLIGGIISKNYQAYKYLPNSISDFFSPNDFCDILKNSGFEVLKIQKNGASFTFVCQKKSQNPQNTQKTIEISPKIIKNHQK